ncbi:calcium-dependent phosphotriesterase superfamily protein [Actinidia rufa]|uniref:Calcium-dependent phosphotriesterase superfamily protein n=1 Tax=Actinidia rufa TaxID=165716 RepID=A0A7J0FKI2_9ERIC|nr:calcium-dependent phosphotriesterase superfamily protein [Actinidia rufa]
MHLNCTLKREKDTGQWAPHTWEYNIHRLSRPHPPLSLSLSLTHGILLLFRQIFLPPLPPIRRSNRLPHIPGISHANDPRVPLPHSTGWLRECTKWDPPNRRFLVSFLEGGVGQIPVPDHLSPEAVLEEVPVVKDADLAGNASLGMVIDRPRNRLLVATADVFGNRYGALAAYDLTSWDRLFLTQLSGPGDEKSFADDVTVDPEGNAYVTDAKANKIWKVGAEGEFLSTIKSPLFTPKEWYKKLGKGDEVKLIEVVGGSLSFGDGLELLSPTKLVVAGNPTRLVESSDEWETATVVGTFKGPGHRLTTAATLKDGKVYLNHMFGLGYPRKKTCPCGGSFF